MATTFADWPVATFAKKLPQEEEESIVDTLIGFIPRILWNPGDEEEKPAPRLPPQQPLRASSAPLLARGTNSNIFASSSTTTNNTSRIIPPPSSPSRAPAPLPSPSRIVQPPTPSQISMQGQNSPARNTVSNFYPAEILVPASTTTTRPVSVKEPSPRAASEGVFYSEIRTSQSQAFSQQQQQQRASASSIDIEQQRRQQQQFQLQYQQQQQRPSPMVAVPALNFVNVQQKAQQQQQQQQSNDYPVRQSATPTNAQTSPHLKPSSPSLLALGANGTFYSDELANRSNNGQLPTRNSFGGSASSNIASNYQQQQQQQQQSQYHSASSVNPSTAASSSRASAEALKEKYSLNSVLAARSSLLSGASPPSHHHHQHHAEKAQIRTSYRSSQLDELLDHHRQQQQQQQQQQQRWSSYENRNLPSSSYQNSSSNINNNNPYSLASSQIPSSLFDRRDPSLSSSFSYTPTSASARNLPLSSSYASTSEYRIPSQQNSSSGPPPPPPHIYSERDRNRRWWAYQ